MVNVNNYAIILAAGKGTRMKSHLYKVLHPVLGKPMISHVVDTLNKVDVKRKIVVVAKDAFAVKELLQDQVEFVVQEEQLGTGHAVRMAEPLLEKETGNTIVLYGDTPLITSETINSILNHHIQNHADITMLTTHLDNPTGYGRIVRDNQGEILRIVEEKDASPEEKQITEVNTGTYCFDNRKLFQALKQLKNNNNQKEYYLTDVIEIIKNAGGKVTSYQTLDSEETFGINDRIALEQATQILKRRVNKELMKNGVTIIDAENTYISVDTIINPDTVIYPGTVMFGKNVIGENCVIGPNTQLENVTVGSNVKIISSLITDSVIGDNTTVGPFAHLRNHTVTGANCRIGNFVEMKNTVFGDNSKASHLSYLGDATVGTNVNMGCGTITVNYDGKKKHKTVIKDNAFVGCNSNLVAPITVGEGAYVAAGSTITADVPDDALAIARSYQVNKPEYAKKYRK
ncbi:MAG: bifunctional UDP-N-acetylglucosamine diphosphorylase/glucosamine-1-phosphate N-acetyltransferase GlmU [Bacilli bacterium]|nr:bifunctional UDP-N-acetylglucosamine diphosphorylase/glucosamine-1-phosphate N-acetyltransferase GlmU [Bacilli bacterium]